MHTLRDGFQHAGIVPGLARGLHPVLTGGVPYRTVEPAIRRLLPALFPAGRGCVRRNQGAAPPGGCTVAGLDARKEHIPKGNASSWAKSLTHKGMAPPARIERATLPLGGGCSIH